jgi:hypothetical protein
MGFHDFVLRVRFETWPDLMMRSNSKLPFWLTGEKVSRVSWPPRRAWSEAGRDGWFGGVILMLLDWLSIGRGVE